MVMLVYRRVPGNLTHSGGHQISPSRWEATTGSRPQSGRADPGDPDPEKRDLRNLGDLCISVYQVPLYLLIYIHISISISISKYVYTYIYIYIDMSVIMYICICVCTWNSHVFDMNFPCWMRTWINSTHLDHLFGSWAETHPSTRSHGSHGHMDLLHGTSNDNG